MTNFDKIIEEVSDRTGIEVDKVNKVIKHMFNWLRFRFTSLEYPEIFCQYLGTFKVIPKRIKDDQLREDILNYYNNKKNKRRDGTGQKSGKNED